MGLIFFVLITKLFLETGSIVTICSCNIMSGMIVIVCICAHIHPEHCCMMALGQPVPSSLENYHCQFVLSSLRCFLYDSH